MNIGFGILALALGVVLILIILLIYNSIDNNTALNPYTYSSSVYTTQIYILSSPTIAFKNQKGSIKYLSDTEYIKERNIAQKGLSEFLLSSLVEDSSSPFRFEGVKVMDNIEFYIYSSLSRSQYALYVFSTEKDITLYLPTGPARTVFIDTLNMFEFLKGSNYSFLVRENVYLTVAVKDGYLSFYLTTDGIPLLLGSKSYTDTALQTTQTFYIDPSYFQQIFDQIGITLMFPSTLTEKGYPFSTILDHVVLREAPDFNFTPPQDKMTLNNPYPYYYYLFRMGVGNNSVSLDGNTITDYIIASNFDLGIYGTLVHQLFQFPHSDLGLTLIYTSDNVQIIRFIGKSTEYMSVRLLKNFSKMEVSFESSIQRGGNYLPEILPETSQSFIFTNTSQISTTYAVNITYNGTFIITIGNETHEFTPTQVQATSFGFIFPILESEILGNVSFITLDFWSNITFRSSNGTVVSPSN